MLFQIVCQMQHLCWVWYKERGHSLYASLNVVHMALSAAPTIAAEHIAQFVNGIG